ncbi:MAG: phytoene desaturase family protein [Jiangellaceae bacterium]
MGRAGLAVEVFEEQPTVGGGARTLDLGLAEGVRHNLCSAVHPMAAASPFFAGFDLAARGVELRYPEVSYAHPLDGGRAGIAYRDLARTVEGLGADGAAWRRVFRPLVEHIDGVVEFGTFDRRRVPWHAATAARVGLRALEQGSRSWNLRWRSDVAPALLTGVAAHTITPLPSVAAGATAVVLGSLAHSPGWPLPVGGSQAITDAMVADLKAHDGVIHTGAAVTDLDALPRADAYLFDTAPAGLLRIVGDRMPPAYARALSRYRYGNAVAKVDFVLSGPVPWQHPEVGRAGTVHVGGTRPEMAEAEAAVLAGRHPERPMLLLSDPALLDPEREVGGLRPLWTYAHVPAGSIVDVGDAVQAQIERFAPGFSDVVVARNTISAAGMERHNANYVGGDIAAGAVTLWQMLARPAPRWNPYATPVDGVYLCSAATPPGPAVHGMGGLHAARHALRDRFGIHRLPSLAP